MIDVQADIIDLGERLVFRSEDELLRHRILGELGALTIEEQGLIGLRFILGEDYAEVARTMGTSEEEARTLTLAALRRLKGRLYPS